VCHCYLLLRISAAGREEQINARIHELVTVLSMSYLPQRIGMWSTRIVGWVVMTLFAISLVAAIPLGNGVVGLLGSAAAAFCPGAALAFGAKPAFEGDKFWWRTVMFLLGALAVGFGVVGLTDGSGWLILVYPVLLIPIIVLFGTVKPTDSSELNGKRYGLITVALYGATAAAAWLLAVIG
jgi:hypothetical protein